MNCLWNRYTRRWVLRVFQYLPVKRRRVMCVSWGGEQYTCNPRAIVEKMADMGMVGRKSFEVFFAFHEPAKFHHLLPKGVEAIEIGSYKYFKMLATSQFVIANTRFAGGIFWPFAKRKGQYYIQTMHGGHGVKKIEHDAHLPVSYIINAEEDTCRTDLMLSNSSYWTRIYRSAFHYQGEVLEKGLPRNDIFFQEQLNHNDTKRYLIYTPTFRNSDNREVYGFDYDRIINVLETRFGGEWYIRISSHPNMRSYYKEIYPFTHPRLIDVGCEDVQTLLLSSDVLITDYSSAEMDFSFTGRPIFQFCKDRATYDRGFYIDPKDLPFPYAETDEELMHNILHFDERKYSQDLEIFNRDIIGLNETGHASEAVINWILSHQ